MPTIRSCTATTASQLPQALKLAAQLDAAEPGATLDILLCAPPLLVARLRSQTARPLLGPDELDCPEWLGLAFAAEPADLPRLLRPWLLAKLLPQGAVVYLPPDSPLRPQPAALTASLGAGALGLVRPLSTVADASTLLAASQHGPFALHGLVLPQGLASERLLHAWQARLLAEQAQASWPPTEAELGLGLASLAAELRLLPAEPLPAVAPVAAQRAESLAAGAAAFASYLNGVAIATSHRRAYRCLPRPNRQAIENPFAEPFLMEQIAAQSLTLGCPHCFELERRLQSLPHALLDEASQVVERLRPGTSDQLAALGDDWSRLESSTRSYARQVLERLLPGSPDRWAALQRDAAQSQNPTLRRLAQLGRGRR